jgi:hypothetical protein
MFWPRSIVVMALGTQLFSAAGELRPLGGRFSAY